MFGELKGRITRRIVIATLYSNIFLDVGNLFCLGQLLSFNNNIFLYHILNIPKLSITFLSFSNLKQTFRRSFYAQLSSFQILAKLNIPYDAIFFYLGHYVFNPFLSWILATYQDEVDHVNICCFCPVLSDNQILIFFSFHLLLLELNPSPNTM